MVDKTRTEIEYNFILFVPAVGHVLKLTNVYELLHRLLESVFLMLEIIFFKLPHVFHSDGTKWRRFDIPPVYT
jgi:hypothetical protein